MYDVEVTIESGKNLKNVNWRNGPLRPYVVAWIDPSTKLTTNADPENDEDPMWNERLVVPLHGDVDNAVLYFDVVHAVDAGQDVEEVKQLVGSGKLPLSEVLEEGGEIEKKVKIKRPSGRPHGKIMVRVCVREKSGYDRSYPPPGSYGYGAPPPHYGAPPPQQYGYGAPPPQQYGYGAPPPQQYGYGAPPPQEYGYGAPPPQEYGHQYGGPPAGGYGNYEQQQVVEKEEKKSKFGGMAGIGAGVAVGAGVGLLGGYALAEALDGSDDEEKEEEEEAAEEAEAEEEDE